MNQDLHQAIANLLEATQKTDLTMKQLSAEAKSIDQKYDPVTLARKQFNNWRSSVEGKTWKQRQFEIIGGKCPNCPTTFPTIRHFVIDHIEPLCDRPDRACDVTNLQLLCHPCNLTKGSGKGLTNH